MTIAGFRRIALGLTDAVEHRHHDHPDFRVGGRIFATLAYPDPTWGMVVLTPEQQRTFLQDHPEAFTAVKGKWGAQGCTLVRLAAADEEALGEALTLARQNAVAKGPTRSAGRTPRAAKKAGAKTRAKR